MRKRDLERLLEQIPEFTNPSPALEQYRTPPGVATDLLWEAHADGAIAGKRVVDLGCGTGTFAAGALALGAAEALGVDVDSDVLATAKAAVPGATFALADVAEWEPVQADTVMFNPPFGAQKKGADRVFYEKAGATGASSVWFLAQPATERYLSAMARDLGKELEKVAQWSYPLVATMDHHAESVKQIQVGGYRLG